MTIIPETSIVLGARSSADFDETFEIYDDDEMLEPADLSGWAFRFVVKASRLDPARKLDVVGAVNAGTGIEVNANAVRVRIDKALLLAALDDLEKLAGLFELQAVHNDGRDAVFSEGPFPLVRGL